MTLGGLLCNATAYGIGVWYCGVDMTGRLPSSALWICAGLYFGWMLLDNMDGKQARRLNCSSPLGLLFDHQVDALNVWMTASLITLALLLSGSPLPLLLWLIGAIPFFYTTWEELYLGSMDFPCINGPNEGCVGIGGLLMYAAFAGGEVFSEEKWMGWEVRYVLIAGFLLAAVVNGMWSVGRVWVKSGRRKDALRTSMGFWAYPFTLAVLYFLSPSQLLSTQTRWVLLCIGCLFAREMAFIQLAHVTSTPYRPLGFINSGILAALAVNTVGNYMQ